MTTITRRNVLRGGGAAVLGAGIAASGGAIAAPVRGLTAKEAAAEFVDAYRLLFERLQTHRIPSVIGCYVMATAVSVERIEAFANDDFARNADTNLARLTEGAWVSWPGRVSL